MNLEILVIEQAKVRSFHCQVATVLSQFEGTETYPLVLQILSGTVVMSMKVLAHTKFPTKP